MRVLTILILVAIPFAAPAFADVKGEWFTDADEALTAAAKTKTPVLAVAMDHG